MVKENRLLLVPSGGLGNRMRAIASAWQLCRRTDSTLQVVWFQGWGMHAAFADLFEPIVADGLSLREARWYDYAVNDRPRRHNLWLPWLPQRLYYRGRVISELQVAGLRDGGFDFDGWLRGGSQGGGGCHGRRHYMSCYDEFGTFGDSCYASLFRPNRHVMQLVAGYRRQLRGYVIGMHIRRTDHVDAISKSPVELFLNVGQRELSAHPDLTIFLATDSEEVKQQLRRVFGKRVVTSAHEASRDSVAGLREGLADLWMLSRCRHIYGSSGSSFSVMAARLGGCGLTVCEVGV